MKEGASMRDFEQRKIMTKDFYTLKPNAPIVLEEFGFYSKQTWISQGHIQEDTDLDALFGFEKLTTYWLPGVGGTDAPFVPRFEVKTLKVDDEYEIVQDKVGRIVKYFKGRREGFMPQYLDFPIKSMEDWDRERFRMDKLSPERNGYITKSVQDAVVKAKEGFHIVTYIVGAFMYLRSLMGAEQLLFMIYDNPELLHACMRDWLELMDHFTSRFQEQIRIDELLFDEDICYNHGPLISPNQIREFLFPYYNDLISAVRNRNNKHSKDYDLIIHLATDGDCRPVIPIYKEIGVNCMSPMEVASGCDVVQIRKEYPDLLIKGGFDKRILSMSKQDIQREVDRIMPFMKKHGGYIPTCDHGVPPETPFENYVYFRELLAEYAK